LLEFDLLWGEISKYIHTDSLGGIILQNIMRKISVSLAVVMLLTLSAPVLTYAASMLKVYYNATTGEISGVIYSDQREISLVLDQEGQSYPVPSSVISQVYYSGSANIYWANVRGTIATGLTPGSATVTAGDTRNFAASVSDDVYSFADAPLPPIMSNGHGASTTNHGTADIDISWRESSSIGVLHYNVYNNGQLIATTKGNYLHIKDMPSHTLQQFNVTSLDILGRESVFSNTITFRVPGAMKEATFSFSGKDAGYSLQPSEEITTFRLSDDLKADRPENWNVLNLTLIGGNSAERYVPFIVNHSEISASDFELVTEDGALISVSDLYQQGVNMSFIFNEALKLDERYTLRLTTSASGKEIQLPDLNSRSVSARMSVVAIKDSDFENFYYYDHNDNKIVVGDPYAPAKPTGLQASGNGELTVKWDSNKEPDLAGYLVWLDGKLLTEKPIQQTSYYIGGLINGKTYHVNVAAVDKAGNRSLQAYIFPIPKAPDSNGGPGGPGGNGGGGTSAPAPGSKESIPAASPVLATVVDKDGTSKTLNIVLKSENNKVKIPVENEAKQLLLPAAGDVLHKENTLVLDRDDFSLAIPGQVLEQLKGLVSAEQLKNARISIAFSPIGSAELAEDTARAVGKTKNISITPAGTALDITLSLVTADGKESKLSQFNLPVTLKLKVAEGSNTNLTGIYYLDELGGLQYLGGRLSDGYLIVDTVHFSKYAVLQYDKTFTDVAAGHWASQAIKSMVAQHVATGTSELTFSPNQQVTRAEFAAFIARKLSLKASGTSDFTDVSPAKWYSDNVAAVVEAGIASGLSETSFAPDRPISRQEMVVMVMKAYAYKYMLPFNVGDVGIPFDDQAEVSPWAKPYAAAAHKLELVQGSNDGKLEPHKKATRAEAVQLISKL
jgi:hypothetical protein